MDRPSVILTLNDAEHRIVRFIGEQRNGSNERHGVDDQRRSPSSGLVVHTDGFGAELAFCKLHNVYPDFEIGPRRGGADCEVLGDAIDVKCRRDPDHQLLIVPGKQLGVDWYALMIGSAASRTFRFAGVIHRNQLAQHRLTNLGYGPTYAIDQSALTGGPLTAAQIFR